MDIFHCAHSKGLEFNAFCLDVTVDVITSRSSAICMDVSLDVNFYNIAQAMSALHERKETHTHIVRYTQIHMHRDHCGLRGTGRMLLAFRCD